MSESERLTWWKDLFRKEVVAGHVVNSLVSLAVTFLLGLIVTTWWLTWSAWHRSFLWQQRAIGAAIAFLVCFIATCVALVILRRRVMATMPPAQKPASKGFLDHRADSARSTDEISKTLGQITALTVKETKRTQEETARWLKINKLPYGKRKLNKEIKEAKRAARAYDRTTRQIAQRVPALAKATETFAQAELAIWKWLTAAQSVDANTAIQRIQLFKDQVEAVQQNIATRNDSKRAAQGRLGMSQILNEAVGRRLIVLDSLSAAMALEIEPLQEAIRLLEPFAETPTENN